MKTPACEKVSMAMMAMADGERAELPPEELKRHLAACEDCRNECVRMQRIGDTFRQAARGEINIDLWPAIESRLDQQARRADWLPFAVVSSLLLVYKLFEMLPDAAPGWAINLVPLIIFAVLLVFLRENPFRINANLALEK